MGATRSRIYMERKAAKLDSFRADGFGQLFNENPTKIECKKISSNLKTLRILGQMTNAINLA